MSLGIVVAMDLIANIEDPAWPVTQLLFVDHFGARQPKETMQSQPTGH
jgi:hypothetical protein